MSSTSEISHVPVELVSRLGSLRLRLLMWLFIDGLVRLLGFALVLLGADFLLDWYFEFDIPQRMVMLGLILFGLAVMFYRRLARPLFCRVTDDALCLQVEDQNQHLGESLIGGLQLSRLEDAVRGRYSQAMVDAAIGESRKIARDLDMRSVLRSGQLAVNLVCLISLAIAFTGMGMAVVKTETLSIWFQRNVLLKELAWPQKVYLEIVGAENGRLRIPRGDDWPVTAIDTDESRELPNEVRLEIRNEFGRRTEIMNRSADGREFQFLLTEVTETFELRARSERARTPWIRAALVDRPDVSSLQLSVFPPEYTGTTEETLPPGRGPYYVLKAAS